MRAGKEKAKRAPASGKRSEKGTAQIKKKKDLGKRIPLISEKYVPDMKKSFLNSRHTH